MRVAFCGIFVSIIEGIFKMTIIQIGFYKILEVVR